MIVVREATATERALILRTGPDLATVIIPPERHLTQREVRFLTMKW